MFFSFFFGKAQDIKTIQLKPLAEKEFTTIVPLGTVLELSFDDLEADTKDFYYKVQHMTPDWEPSNLITNQYINGFDQNLILNTNNSFNTFQNYTNYSIQIPNPNTIITKSGNYLLSVLDEDYNVLFSRRFVFYENTVTVGVAVFRSRVAETNNSHQNVQFSINHPNLNINIPNQEIKVVLLQNENWNTSIDDLKPQFFRPGRLLYNYTKKSNFFGGNEFLSFDNKYIRNTSLNIAKTELKDIFHNYLYVNEPRVNRVYTYNPDINGQFLVRTLDGSNPKTEADYAMMHFALDAPDPFENKEVFVYGGFNNFQLTDENVMTYNKERKAYETNFMLKQGFYNYNFVTLDSDGVLDLTEIGGSFFETENEYTAIVYYKPFGALFHRVIGVGRGFFNQNR